MMMLFIWLAISSSLQLVRSNVTSWVAKKWYKDEITAQDGLEVFGYNHLNGYATAAVASWHTEVYINDLICAGGFSCANSIFLNESAYTWLWQCFASYSCLVTNTNITVINSFVCTAYMSCPAVVLYMNGYNTYMECWSIGSCAYTVGMFIFLFFCFLYFAFCILYSLANHFYCKNYPNMQKKTKTIFAK